MTSAMSWSDWANYTTATAPGLALIAWFGRVLWRKIRHELEPNSGSSLRDAVDRIETMVTDTQHELEKHISYHKGQESQQ